MSNGDDQVTAQQMGDFLDSMKLKHLRPACKRHLVNSLDIFAELSPEDISRLANSIVGDMVLLRRAVDRANCLLLLSELRVSAAPESAGDGHLGPTVAGHGPEGKIVEQGQVESGSESATFHPSIDNPKEIIFKIISGLLIFKIISRLLLCLATVSLLAVERVCFSSPICR
jgi:hypothetical protein